MKVIVDECLPNRLCKALRGHDAVLVQKAGYGGLKDRALLDQIEGEFDAFITIDGNLTYQQNLARRRVRIVVLRALTNSFNDVQPLVPRILEVLATLEPGTVIYIGREDV